ncbi:MAG: hypothetical protein IIU00_00450 [Clostridia bacterium]|nr:hypothetical protein [Clostridia bacterium]
MTPFEYMAAYEIGLEMGLYSLDDLRQFLNLQMRRGETPYLYTDVFLSIGKGQEEVINTIFYNLQGNYTADRSLNSSVRRMLIAAIRNKWDFGRISTEQCVGMLEKLNDYFETDGSCATIGEFYRLNQSGSYSDRDFAALLGGILLSGDQ